uniref:Elongator complex protein 4 n=1 Tax=Triatoma infestans TaxID=30076 RepID=A0A171AB37_TRIIF
MDFGSSFISMKSHEKIASGIPSLDAVLGGGMLIGSLILLSEDSLGIYSDMFLKVFLAQGIVKDEEVLFASCDVSPDAFMRKLPQQTSSEMFLAKQVFSDTLQIAWRYENSPAISIFDANKSHSNNFSFKDRLPDEIVQSSKPHYWPSKGNPETYEDLLDCIYKKLITGNNLNEQASKNQNKGILRIGVHRLGSLFWKQSQNRLPRFLYSLRGILHHSRSIAVVTFPKHLIQKSEIISRCEQMSDSVIELESFGANTNPLYNELDGYIKFTKLCTSNTLCPLMKDPCDWAFRLSLKKLIIEKLRLPPEGADSTQREHATNQFCGQTKDLDF